MVAAPAQTAFAEAPRPKDVGILAMEMYFPRRVRFSSVLLFVYKIAHRHFFLSCLL